MSSKPCDFIVSVENVLQTTIRQLKLPVSQRSILNGKSRENLEQFQTLLKEMKAKLETKVGSLKDDLLPYLQTDAVRQSFHNWDVSSLPVKQKAAVDAGKVEQFVYVKLFQIVDSHCKETDLQQWARTALDRDVAKAEQMLKQANMHMSGSVQPTFRINDNHGYLLPYLCQLITICAAFGVTVDEKAVLRMVARSGIGDFFATVVLPKAVAAVPTRLTIVAFVGSLVAVAVARKLWKIKAIKEFKENVKQAYDNYIADTSQLQEIISTVMQFHCKHVQAVLDTLPQMHKQIQKTLHAVGKAEEKNCPKYEQLLSKWQELNGKLSILTLQCMPHKFTSNDILWPQPNPPVGSGSFAEVYKVTIPGAHEVALKVIRHDVTQGNTASEVKKEFDVCRYQILIFIVSTMYGLLNTYQISFW